MNNAHFVEYYHLLFNIEVAVFGIISAVILVFVQLIYSNYSYRQIWHILKDWFFVLFLVCSVVDLLMTAAAIYLLLVGSSIFTIEFFSSVKSIITNPFYAFACLALIFVSISFFLFLIAQNITYLQPHRAVFLISKGLHYKNFRDFLWKKYEPEPPANLRFINVGFDLLDDTLGEETEEERRSRLDAELEARKNELNSILSKIETINKKVANSEDPLLPMRDMMILFIKRSDISSLNEASVLLSKISNDFITQVPKPSEDVWMPESLLPMGFTNHLIENLQTLMEIAEKEGLESAKKEILKVSLSYAISIFEREHFQEVERIVSFWQIVADSSIGRSSSIFQQIIEYYSELGEQVLDSLEENSANQVGGTRISVLNSIFRNIGWLGERMLVKMPLEESPIMHNYDYSSDYDALFNCLLNFSDIYNYKHPTSYPLIYFDALSVVLLKLIKILKQQKDRRRLKEDIFSIVFVFASFAEYAIKVDNASGAGLAITEVWDSYKDLKQERHDGEAYDAIKLLVKVGFLAAAYQNTLKRVDFLSKPIHEWIADKLVEAGENIEDEVMDKYIHTIRETNNGRVNAWTFMTELGKRMGTNFGFAFDYNTGELYADDDPRRR